MTKLNIVTETDLQNYKKQNAKIHSMMGIIFISWEDEDGRFHRLNGPAVIMATESGVILSQEWFRRDELHRVDGPARVYTDELGRLQREEWFLNGIRGRKHNMPCVIEYYKNGSQWLVAHKRQGDSYKASLLRPDGSLSGEAWGSSEMFSEIGEIDFEALNRSSGPAVITYDNHGRILSEEWWKNGKCGREQFSGHLVMKWEMKVRQHRAVRAVI